VLNLHSVQEYVGSEFLRDQ